MKWSSLFSRLGDEQVSELAELAWWKSRSDSSRVVLLISSSGLQMRVCLLQSTCLMRMKTGVTNKTLRLWAKLSWRTPRRRTAAIMSRWEIHTVKLPAAREGQTLFSYRPLILCYMALLSCGKYLSIFTQLLYKRAISMYLIVLEYFHAIYVYFTIFTI